jgi:hypothetical protein
MKEFNITGTCIPERHYMVDTSNKIQKIIQLIDKGKYFTINRPRQYGKTTTLFFLEKALKDRYLLISISFEGLGEEAFENVTKLSEEFMFQLRRYLKVIKEDELIQYIQQYEIPDTFGKLSLFISDLVNQAQRKIILMIDEVDKASNHIIFLNFLGVLRNKYLDAAKGSDQTFHSVILAGVHDIKNIKKKIRPDSQTTYNSPWNIATDFDIDMSFSAEEIGTMLDSYFRDQELGDRGQGTGSIYTFDTSIRFATQCPNVTPPSNENSVPNAQHPISNTLYLTPDSYFPTQLISTLSQTIHKFTSGYPFLVSKICKLIDEKLDKDWSIEGIQKSINIMLGEQNTLFDDLIKNIENNPELYNLIYSVLIDAVLIHYNSANPIINTAIMYGIIDKDAQGKIKISNKIFEVYLYEYLVSKLETSNLSTDRYRFRDSYIDPKGNINMEHVLLRFQQFIQETYSDKNEAFYERHGRLLLIAFVKPIINGEGFYYIESQHSYERRSDMIIMFNKIEYILEFKLWYGEQYHQDGLKQLAGYLDSRNQTTGFLVAFNFNKNKQFTNGWNEVNGKKIFEVIV